MDDLNAQTHQKIIAGRTAIVDYRLSELLDLGTIQRMAEAHYRAAGMPIGIIDAIDGSVIVGCGWQDICLKFHRANPASLQRCRESDNYIKDRLVPGEACHYRCKNGLWDLGIPILVSGRHLATMFLGQFFYEGERPDVEYFANQAREFGFDVDGYLAALGRVPVFSREKVETIIEYNKALVVFISEVAEHSLSRFKADRLVRESERKFRGILDHTYELIGLLSADGTLIEANQAAVKFSAVEAENAIGKPFWQTAWFADCPELSQKIREAVGQAAEGKFVRFEANHSSANGAIHVDFSFNPVFGDSGNVDLLIVEGRDITELKRAEAALRESEERFRQVVESSPVGMFIATEDGRFRYLNPAAVNLFGANSAEELVGASTMERVHPASRAAVRERIRQVHVECRSVPFRDEQFVRLDGSVIDMEATAIPYPSEGRNCAIVFLRDITERIQQESKRAALEQQLRQAHKMEAVGQLAGGIAHEFNNLLMVIQSYTQMLQDEIPFQNRRKAREIMKAADRAASLTRQLLAFSRKQAISPTVLDLNAVIHDTVGMLRPLLGETISIQMRPQDYLWSVKADSDQIVQVLMNLCLNARDAMPQGGTVTIATRNLAMEQSDLDREQQIAAGDYVMLAISDTGIGMDEELCARIFEPFFTTKEVGKGTGLGLSTVYGIVRQSGGYITVTSSAGQGASFMVYLPRYQEEAASKPVEISEPAMGGNEFVMVAEDEEPLREAICEYLRGLGYTVLAASTGRHALDLASEHDGPIDLLITDLVMPGMSGRELSQILGTLRPGLKTMYMSGYSDDAVWRDSMHNSDSVLLKKPFGLGTLARKIRTILVSN